jgi:O-methyltransferase
LQVTSGGAIIGEEGSVLTGLLNLLKRSYPDAKARWMRGTYEAFRQQRRREVFLAIAVYHHHNQPVDGYYMEFGCHGGRTIRLAWDAFHVLFDRIYVGFDSFQGLPPMEPDDQMPIWKPGALATSERDFRRCVLGHGIPPDRLRTVKGWFEESLTPELVGELLPTRAAVIYVDCDLYASTVPVLQFARPFLQRGTVLVFDDWFCFHGDPDRGQRRAFREFRRRYPEVAFEEFLRTSEVQAFVVIDPGTGLPSAAMAPADLARPNGPGHYEAGSPPPLGG